MVRANTSMPMEICSCPRNVSFGSVSDLHTFAIMFNWPIKIKYPPNLWSRWRAGLERFPNDSLRWWKEVSLRGICAVAFEDTGGQRVCRQYLLLFLYLLMGLTCLTTFHIFHQKKYKVSFLKHQVLTQIPLHELVARLPLRSADVRNTAQNIRSTLPDELISLTL